MKNSWFGFLTHLRSLVTVSILTALAVASKFATFFIGATKFDPAGPAVIMIAGMMYGPIAGAIVGGLADILGFLVYNPSGYAWNPVVTVGNVCLGFFTGLFYWIFKYFSKPKQAAALPIIISAFGGRLIGFFVITWGLIATYKMDFYGTLMARLPSEPFLMIWYLVVTLAIMLWVEKNKWSEE